MSRREFTKSVKVGIIQRASGRAGGGNGLLEQFCEKCGEPTKGRFEIHHLREDALEVDKSKRLTTADGQLWCKPCHDEHTKKFSIPAVAKAKRREAKHLGVKADTQKIQSPGFPKAAKEARISAKPSLPPRALYR